MKAERAPLRVIVFGYGRMGKNHVRNLRLNPRFQLVGIVDPLLGTQGVKNIDGVPCFGGIKDLPITDCAVVATPTSRHYEVARQLLDLRIPLLVEKPLCASSQEAEALCAQAESLGVPLFVGQIERFNPAIRKLQEIVSHGWLGDPIHFSFTRVGGYPEHVTERENVLLDLAVHDLDVFKMFGKEIDVVACLCHGSLQPGIYDTAEILVEGVGGVSGAIHVNWITPTKIRALRVTGTRAVCLVDYMLQTCTLFGGHLLGPRAEPKTDFPKLIEAYRNSDRVEFGVQKEEPLSLELEAFYQALNGGESRIATGREGAEMVRLVERSLAFYENRNQNNSL